VTVVEATFEAWAPTVEGAHLVFSADTWQWLDPAVRWAKAADVLRPGGHLALVWQELNTYGVNLGRSAAQVAEADAALVALIDGEFGGAVDKHEDAVVHLTARAGRTA
jgi:hypothetical protein